ncbi:MAG: CotH kinase family protein, partial [Bacteroidetes bacterium]|nr:CotH kinase family protein [Bacteroidota bacterium]
MKNCLFTIILCYTALRLLTAQELYHPDSVRTFHLYFYDEDWDSKLDDSKLAGNNERILAELVVNGIRYDSVGVKFKGNSSYSAAYMKNPFNIDMDYVIKGQALMGYKKLKLSNLFKDPTGIREALAYHIARNYMPVPECSYVFLYIADKPVGLYLNVEPVDKEFRTTQKLDGTDIVLTDTINIGIVEDASRSGMGSAFTDGK